MTTTDTNSDCRYLLLRADAESSEAPLAEFDAAGFRLFLAAPDLLEELKAAVAAYEDIIGAMGNDDPYTLEELTSALFANGFESARQAIARAEASEAD